MTTDESRVDPITRLAAGTPAALAAVLLAFAVACLVPAFLYGHSAFFANTPIATETNPDDPEAEPQVPKPTAVDPFRGEHIAYTLGGIVGAILAASLAVFAFTAPMTLTEPQKLTRARIALLAAGSLLGGATMLFALGLFIVWFDSVTKWLDAGDVKQAPRVLIPIVVALVGAALMFLGAMPARAEERNNPFVRRLIYGTNLGLSAMLLLFALLAGNILLALKLPNKLDTTETGFYSLTESTKKYLGNLEQPVTLYTNISADSHRLANDARRLLDACQEANPAQFHVRPLTNTSKADKDELARLQKKYPQFDLNDEWVLVTAGEDESRSAFIPLADMIGRENADRSGRGGTQVFSGEGKLMREVLFLVDNKNKPVIYFTQGHGELSIGSDPQEQVLPNRSAKSLKAFLEKNYADVRPWQADLNQAKVPDDATVVIVADPRSTIPPATATALQTYMTTQFPAGRRGKLIVLSSPFATVKGTGVAETALEGLLGDFQIVLNKGYLMAERTRQLDFGQFEGFANPNLIQQGNSLAVNLRKFTMQDMRIVSVKPSGGPEAAISASMLMFTFPPNRITWIDPNPPIDPSAQLEMILKDRDLQVKYQAQQQRPMPIAAVASEGKTPRVVVFGSGTAFADGRGEAPPVDIIAAAIDWLRDRPTLSAINKPYSSYSLPKTADGFRLFWLPVGLVLLGTAVAGLGVWVVRRK